MRLIVTTETHYVMDTNGHSYCPTGVRGYLFWKRYLDVFESVTVIARVSHAQEACGSPVEGAGVSVVALPDYVGPVEFLGQLPELKRRVRRACQEQSAVIIDGGPVGSLVWAAIRKQRRPYGIEVVGDPYDVFAPGAVRHPLRAFFRWWVPRQLGRECREAAAACYVTERTLQRRYPPGSDTISIHCSDVHLPAEAVMVGPRTLREGATPFRLITVGSLAQLYKAPDVLIDAVALCARQGMDLQVTFVGDGKHRPELEARARQSGVGDRVRFLGKLAAGAPVREELDRADLFVLPSRTEGLPRALVEAMARALPCIGTTVGGFSELLAPDDLIPPGNVTALAAKLREVLCNPDRMVSMSIRNLARARDFSEDALYVRRIAFYNTVKERTVGWLEQSMS